MALPLLIDPDRDHLPRKEREAPRDRDPRILPLAGADVFWLMIVAFPDSPVTTTFHVASDEGRLCALITSSSVAAVGGSDTERIIAPLWSKRASWWEAG